MSVSKPLHDYLHTLERLGREAFLRDHPDPVLVITHLEESPAESWTGFNTLPSSTETNDSAEIKTERLKVAVISKSPGSPWRGRISVGRARNTDVMIQTATISKLHAHFTVDEGGGVRITDAGSQNGTRVNGTLLERDAPASLNSGDLVGFGTVDATFYSAAGFCEFLTGLLPPSR
jgi:hypothetical protein